MVNYTIVQEHYIPKPGEQPKYGQVYIIEGQQAIDARLNQPQAADCDPKNHEHNSRCAAQIPIHMQLHTSTCFKSKRNK